VARPQARQQSRVPCERLRHYRWQQRWPWHTILFSDAEEGLAKRNAAGRKLCNLFNQIAPAYGAEPIAAAELDEAVGVEVLKAEGYLVSLTRAEVDVKLGNGLSVGRWLLPILQGEE
jgi:hypothetical protein